MALIVTLFVSCEEYYTPDLDEVSGLLVVESHLTNDPSQNYVRLSMTQGFYSQETTEKIVGAKVELVEVGSQVMKATETSTGYFTFPQTPVVGRTYLLRITYGKDIYESESAIMPPLPQIDTLYTRHKIAKYYRTNAYGIPDLIEIPEREIYIDAPITEKLEYYRFTWKAIIQWFYNPPALEGPPPPSLYGWKTRYDNGLFNLAGPKEFSNSDKVRNHPILSLNYDGKIYLDSATQIPSGWIVIIDQYGITKSSNDFHEKLNKQFAAEGSLFDPVLTQVYGNIHCKNDASKIALGYFDVNSYRQYRYYFDLGSGPDEQVTQRRLNRYFDIPYEGYETGTRPIFWETNYY